ncbi:DUF2878 domain-containing protein [Pseudoalteromonas sp. C2R02]|uniref:DUF2878 domain-containing protein n=1 Tax=Pseudoalteromonas sp. C2R02 TaxID=2841565 RepID=UPI001C08F0D2|nr:DUF2878 domain-containing protein [Pseudoalteromonas sp. C2R02]MBU2967961.1 DUF2878 domain-containing protein [Pseudoalteromonas sp. C2R02]
MKYFNIINLSIYQISWFIAALYPGKGALFIAALIVIHFIMSPSKLDDFRLLNIAVIGCVVDCLMIYFNVIITSNNELPSTLMLLWCVFAVTFNHCLHWLSAINVKYISLIGLVLGPASYYGALNLNTFETTLTDFQFISLYGFIWALLLPIFVKYYIALKVLFNHDNEAQKL